MTSLTESVKYPAMTVRNIYCDTIRVSNSNTSDNYIATFVFNPDSGVHGLLLAEVKRQYRDTSYIIDNIAMAITCDPAIIDKDTTVVDYERSEDNATGSTRSRRRSHTVLSMTKLSSVASRRPRMMCRVNLTFRDVFVYKDSAMGKDTWFVTYSSFDTVVLSPMRVCERKQ